MTVALTASATDDLDEIWRWNAGQFGPNRANEYLVFLRREIDALAWTHARGRDVGDAEDYRYLILRRRRRGAGHVAVYRVDGGYVIVRRVLHTAQDWRQHLIP